MRSARWAGIKASFTATSWLPVALRPVTCQVSRIVKSLLRHQQQIVVFWCCPGGRAEQCPIGMLAAAGIGPLAVQPESAFNWSCRPSAADGAANKAVRVLAPDVGAGAIVEQRNRPGNDAEHADDPRGRHIHRTDRHFGLIDRRGLQLIAAPALGLDGAEKTSLLQSGDDPWRHATVTLPFGCRVGNNRDKIARTL